VEQRLVLRALLEHQPYSPCSYSKYLRILIVDLKKSRVAGI